MKRQHYRCKNLITHTYCGTCHATLKTALAHCDKQKGRGWTVRQITGEGTPFRHER